MANGQEILICDDQPMIHETLGVYLENEGFTYCSAYDGEQALQMFDSKKPDLVILDLMMPKKSGTEVCREIRAKSRTPIIMLTAKGAGELYVESTNEKDGYFVVKGTPKLEFYWEVKTRQKGNRDTRIEQSDITEKEDITAEEQEMLNEQMRNQMMLLYEMEKDEIEVQEEQNRIIERMEESE